MFTGAVEKQKLVYILNRDAQARLTISSPLEAHKSNTIVYHMVGVDVGFENPTFACLEIDYEVCKLAGQLTNFCIITTCHVKLRENVFRILGLGFFERVLTAFL